MKIITRSKKIMGVLLLSLPGLLHSQLIDCYTDISCDQQFLSCGQVIRNNSFEKYGQISNSCNGNIEDACCWLQLPGHQGTGDLMNTAFPDVSCSGGTYILDLSPTASSGLIESTPPTAPFGNVQNGYAGFFTLDKRTLTAGTYREYICQQLTTPINPGETANISFQVTLSDFSNRATVFQVSFVNDLYTGITYTGVNGNITSIPASNYTVVGPFSNSTGWVTVNTSWTNTTALPVNYVIIGNVLDYSPTMATAVPATPVTSLPVGTEYQCYYGIDDVSIEKTQTCCSNKDTTLIAYNTGNPSSDDILMSAIYSGIFPAGITNIYIQGELIIDGNYTLTNKNITFGAGSKVTIQSGRTFTITGSHLHGCDQMWEGIYMLPLNSAFVATGSIIEDAKTAVYVNNNTYLNATSTLFRNNYIGVHYQNCTFFSTHPLVGCTFKTTINNSLPFGGSNQGYLLPPYNGKYGHCGVSLYNSATVKLRPPLAADRNYFQYLNFGVIANKSGVEISNADFAQIYNYDSLPSPVDNGIAILAKNDSSAIFRTIKVTDATGQVKIANCDNGIFVRGRIQTTISKNLIQSINYRAIIHYLVPTVTAAPNFQMNVTENTIKNAFEGIMYIDCGKTRSNTYKNTLQWLQEKPGSRGIIVEQSTIGANALCSNDPTGLSMQITDNSITKYVIGFSSSNATCMNVSNNTLTLSSPSNAQHHGMWLNKSPYNIITGNKVYGNYKDGKCIGIRIWNSPGVNVGCNIVDNHGIAFFLDNDLRGAGGSIFSTNTLTNYKQGFLLVASAKLGPQYTIGATNYNTLNQFDKTLNTDYEFVADQSVVGSNSVFYFKPGTMPPTTDINSIYGAVIDNFGNVIPALSGPTNSSFPSGGFTLTMQQYLNLNDNPIHQTYTLPYGICVRDNSGMREDISENLRSGSVTEVEFVEDYAYSNEHTWIYRNNVYRDYLLVKEEINGLPAGVEALLTEMENSNIGTLNQVEEYITEGDYATALSINEALVPQGNYETKLQEINSLLIPEWEQMALNEDYYVSDGHTIDNILSIANLCMVEYGESVLKARLFIHNHVDPNLEFIDPCELLFEERSVMVSDVNTHDVNNKFAIYPNPATHLVNLSYTGTGEVMYSVTDILGRSITNGIFTQGLSLDVAGWENGVYLVKLRSGNHEETLRLVITK